jgi:hypothetical protein
MQADVQRDLGTSSLSAEISAAIPRIIKTYQSLPFWFNESRSYTFDTVAGTVWYGEAQDVDIGLIRQLDGVVIEDATNGDYVLKPMNVLEIEYLTDVNSSQADPIGYAYYDQKIGLYPIPDDVYTVRLFGTFALAAPTDDTAGNAWMVEAYDMIRAAVGGNLAFFKLRNFDLASSMMKMAKMKEEELLRDSMRRMKRGTVRASTF